jgi:hypothetical protein
LGKPKRGKKRKSAHSPYLTMTAFQVGCFACAAIIYLAEDTYGVIVDTGYQISKLPGWRAHMGSVCLGIIAFVMTFFLLEVLSRESKVIAWKTSAPWIPLIALTALATIIHVPAYVVIVVGAGYGIWAFRHTVLTH